MKRKAFKFPKQIAKFQIVNDQKDLMLKLDYQISNQQRFQQLVSYSFKYSSQLRLLDAKCQFCRCRLRYQKQKQVYVLKRYSNHHKHSLTYKKSKLETLTNMLSYYQKAGVQVSRKFTLQKLPCSQSTYYKARGVIDGLKVNEKSFSQLIKSLDQQGYIIAFQPYCEDLSDYKLPELLVVISPSMQIQYQKYGRCLYLDTTYGMCKEKPNFKQDQQIEKFNLKNLINDQKKRNRQFSLTSICGLNCYRKIVVFGFAIVLDESAETTYKVLKTFFSQQKAINTQTIITDGAIGIWSAISKLKNQGFLKCQHLTDFFHFLRNIKIKGKQKRNLLSNMYKAQTLQQYFQKINQLKQIVSEQELQEVYRFNQKSKLFCFSRIPLTFVHNGSSSSPCQKLNDMVKRKIKFGENYVSLVRKLCKAFQKINIKSEDFIRQSRPIEQMFGFFNLKKCRQNLSKLVFGILINQIGRSFRNLITVNNSESKSNLEYIVSKPEFVQNFIVTQQQRLKCNCGYWEKTYLPCDHLISVLGKRKIEIFQYVGDFYKQNINSGIKSTFSLANYKIN